MAKSIDLATDASRRAALLLSYIPARMSPSSRLGRPAPRPRPSTDLAIRGPLPESLQPINDRQAIAPRPIRDDTQLSCIDARVREAARFDDAALGDRDANRYAAAFCAVLTEAKRPYRHCAVGARAGVAGDAVVHAAAFVEELAG